ncbi:nitrile hydratase accessory protein [Salinarimonas rosea]|uniref:nitrile hydratase accessory protein n=1 Tax=Salinarimonas rosea TaxID=552063 RepID=UPI000425CD04|nr:nitrile hydratase accessory protein [Salinarimonas rosea]
MRPEDAPLLPEEAPTFEAPTFEAPWQANAFALAVALNARGAFSWSEWAQALSCALAQTPGAENGGAGYWTAWVAALERLTTEKGLAGTEALGERAAAWQRAAEATPHGTPITLENDPQRRGVGRG